VRILVVEDSSAMRAFVRAALADEPDLELVEASSGFDALRLLPRSTFDLVITDINMPDVNGLEVIAFVRRSPVHHQTPLLIISTESAVRDRERAMQLGADAYLAKPFQAEALRDAVRRLRSGAAGSSGGPEGAGEKGAGA
jgi:two-component system chemotaxis response regulator CheY